MEIAKMSKKDKTRWLGKKTWYLIYKVFLRVL